MLQLCFGDSVKGSLTCAPHMSNTVGGVTAVVLSSAKPLETPLQKAAFAVYRTLAALGERGPYEMGALLKYERPLPAAARRCPPRPCRPLAHPASRKRPAARGSRRPAVQCSR